MTEFRFHCRLGRLLFVAAFFGLMVGPSIAAKADRDQKVDLSSVAMSSQSSNGETTYTFEGDVKLGQGTIQITAERAVIKVTAKGRAIEFFGGPGKQATFRQKREGTSEFAEAWADRGDYDERIGTIRLFSNVRFKSEGDTVRSEYAEYNSATEAMVIRNRIPGTTDDRSGDSARVIFEIQPRNLPDQKAAGSK